LQMIVRVQDVLCRMRKLREKIDMGKISSDLFKLIRMQLVILLLIIGVLVTGYYFRKDALIFYHKWGQDAALKNIRKYGAPAPDKKYYQYNEKYRKHRDALIEIGYLAKKTFDVQYISANSPEMRKIMTEFSAKHPHVYYSVGAPLGTKTVEIICPTKVMPAWEQLIKKYDVYTDPNNPLAAPNDL
jgi:hypothetical protein